MYILHTFCYFVRTFDLYVYLVCTLCAQGLHFLETFFLFSFLLHLMYLKKLVACLVDIISFLLRNCAIPSPDCPQLPNLQRGDQSQEAALSSQT